MRQAKSFLSRIHVGPKDYELKMYFRSSSKGLVKRILSAIERSPAVAGFILATLLVMILGTCLLNSTSEASKERLRTLEILTNSDASKSGNK
ncbi:MAG: hypothetical protein JST51_11610 [Armatimonadetes bacterium]|nr:hypothetical protein [Armatimonadota bacterium]